MMLPKSTGYIPIPRQNITQKTTPTRKTPTKETAATPRRIAKTPKKKAASKRFTKPKKKKTPAATAATVAAAPSTPSTPTSAGTTVLGTPRAPRKKRPVERRKRMQGKWADAVPSREAEEAAYKPPRRLVKQADGTYSR